MSAITHQILVKKPYKVVQQILEPHYNNTSETEGEYKHTTSQLEILLAFSETTSKDSVIHISFPNNEYTLDDSHIRITQSNTDRKNLAYFVQKQICNIYDILGKKYYESSIITLKWRNHTTMLPFIYPQFAYELSHNLPGKDFLENASPFNAKFDLVIYDKTLYRQGKYINKDALFYKIKMELKGIKTEEGVEIINSNYHHINHALLSTIIHKDYIDKTELWLIKSSNNENKHNILSDFVDHIIQIMRDNN